MQISTEPNALHRQLSFPEGGGNFVNRGPNGESVVLTSSSEWSRKISDGFRLHASRSLTAPAALEWTQVPLNGLAHQLAFSVRLAVDHSAPVYVVLKASADQKFIGAWSAEVSHEGVSCEMQVPVGFEFLSIQLEALRFSDLENGQVSVIDVAPIEFHQLG